MSTLSKALKIYNVYKTFNETAELDLKTSFKDPVQRAPFRHVSIFKAHHGWIFNTIWQYFFLISIRVGYKNKS